MTSTVLGKAYHYTSCSNWDNILRGKKLEPTTPIALREEYPSGLPDWAYEGYIFCFLNEICPEQWRKHKKFFMIWEHLMNHATDIGNYPMMMLIEFDVTSSDEAYVLDRGHIERFRVDETKYEFDDDDVALESRKRYVGSRVPLTDYNGDYELPELIIKNPIALSRITEGLMDPLDTF